MELFNQNYIKIVENSSGKKPLSPVDYLNASQDNIITKETISVYSNHSSIKKKGILNIDSKFDLQQPTAGGINKIIKSLDTNKATGPNGIPAKLVQMSANVIDCHLSNIIAWDISENKYSEHAKTATIR